MRHNSVFSFLSWLDYLPAVCTVWTTVLYQHSVSYNTGLTGCLQTVLCGTQKAWFPTEYISSPVSVTAKKGNSMHCLRVHMIDNSSTKWTLESLCYNSELGNVQEKAGLHLSVIQ